MQPFGPVMRRDFGLFPDGRCRLFDTVAEGHLNRATLTVDPRRKTKTTEDLQGLLVPRRFAVALVTSDEQPNRRHTLSLVPNLLIIAINPLVHYGQYAICQEFTCDHSQANRT